MPDSPRDYKADYDVDALIRAAEIKDDPKRLARAQAYAKQRAKDAEEAANKVSSDYEDSSHRGYRVL